MVQYPSRTSHLPPDPDHRSIGDMGPILEITEMLLLRAELQPIRNTVRLITTDKVIRIVYKYKKIIRV